MTDQPTTELPVNKTPRKSHTPAERATEAVRVLQRRLDKLTKGKAALELQALELEPQIEAMQKRIDYALSNPDLPLAVAASFPAPLGERTTGHQVQYEAPTVADLLKPATDTRKSSTTKEEAWHTDPV